MANDPTNVSDGVRVIFDNFQSSLYVKEDVNLLLEDIILWILSIAGTVALAVLLFGAFQFLTSLGDESKTKSAKKTILYAVLGLLTIGVSFLLVKVVGAILVP